MVRFAKETDLDFVKNSWAECFDDPPAFVEWNFKHNYSPQNTLIAEAENTPASVMQLMPYTLSINGHSLAARYVSGVATMPTHRKKGLVRELFNHALPHMHDMGCDISILCPAVDGMYEKFGYVTVHKRSFYATDALCGSEISDFESVPFDRLDKIYSSAMEQKGFYIKRSKTDWEKIITDLIKLSGGKVLLFENGYALAYPKDNRFEVCEACGSCTLSGKPVQQLPVMARVINAEKIRRIFPNFTQFGLTDRFIPQNNFLPKGNGKAIDISEFTKKLFADLSDGYINMLL